MISFSSHLANYSQYFAFVIVLEVAAKIASACKQAFSFQERGLITL